MKAKYKSIFFTDLVAGLLILLWVYTAGSKLLAFSEFQSAMANQVFDPLIQKFLIYAVPSIEFSAALMLCFNQSKLAGFILSLGLLIAFTAYITLILTGFFSRVPCGCGGVLKSMGWKTHLYFNLFFLTITSITIFHLLKERRLNTEE